MCDYSLEMYASRPAREGEQYQTTRFASGSIGVTVPKDGTTAICIACDTRLELENIPATVRDGCGVGPREVVTFSSLPYGGYRDAVMFENGKQVSLQQLGEGVRVSIVPQHVETQLERIAELV